ncbi:MAG: MaoC family dehydratase [Beijerinckiaceae bacterium]
MSHFFEDLKIGDQLALGSHRFTRDAIIRFAEQFDPQRFHLSDEGAAQTHFGRLCASGWHTASVWMRLMVDTRRAQDRDAVARGEKIARLGGSPGFRDLKWHAPVFVDDVVTYTSTLRDKRNSTSMPDWGIVTHHNTGVNQDGKLVFEFQGVVFVERRIRHAS